MSARVTARQRAQPWRVLRQPSVSRTSQPQHTGATRTVISRLQREVGNRGLHRLLQSGLIRAKLTVGPSDDEYEREADRVADEVMRMPALTLGSPGIAPIVQRKCGSCEQEEEKKSEDERRVQAERTDTRPPAVTDDLAVYLHSRAGHGRPLDPATRTDMEARFGHDFRRVLVHDDAGAAGSAQAINARAYTFGHHVVFGAGQFAPGTSGGRRLLAHELTHVMQQNGTVVRRDDKPGVASKGKANNLHFVVGDKTLNVGGAVFLPTMEDLKTELLKTSMTGGEWTLSITMHGAEKFFGLSSGDVTGGIPATDPRAYSENRVRRIFGDTKFQTWRKAHGPKRINLISCQVGPDLENTFLQLVQHPSSKQKAVGLGEGCLLVISRVDTTVALPGTKDIVPLKTREQYKKLEEPEKSRVDKWLTALNDTYGYNGEKIKPAALRDYYFDEAPEGSWLKLEVIAPSGTRIPALNRAANDVFINECHPSKVEKRPRQPGVPVPRDEQE